MPLEGAILIIRDAHSLIDFPTQGRDGHEQGTSPLLVVDARRMDGDEF
jgi:hypothetical protein